MASSGERRSRSGSGRRDGSFSTRSRILAYGFAVGLIAAGILCAALAAGGTGQAIAITLVGTGLVAVVSLVFLEVGFSEDRARHRGGRGERPEPEPASERGHDRDRAAEPGRRAGALRPQAPAPARPPSARGLRPRRLERRRGERRRLR